MGATLYVIPGSHPSWTGRLMLERKGIEYRRIDLVSPLHRGVLRLVGFDGVTVPALKIDGQRLQGTTTLSRALDAMRPDPPLFPSDPERRQAVEEAEAWGDEVLQPVPRRLSWASLRRDRSGVGSFLQGARLGIPVSVAARTAAPLIYAAARANRATDEAVRADLERLPELIGHVDELIAAGTIGGDDPNAADYQIAPSVRLLMCFEDVRPALEGRPAARLAERLLPDFPGRVGPALPADWLAPLER